MSKKLPLALLAFALLGGCAQTPSEPKVDPHAVLQFQQAFQSAVYRSISERIEEPTVGAVSLNIVVNRQGQALSCKAVPARPELLATLPFDVPHTEPSKFASQAEQYCRQGIYPTAPDTLYDNKGLMKIVAPVHVVFPGGDLARWTQRNPQRRFFSEQLLRGEKVDSIGMLVVRYQLAEHYQRSASGCFVDLRPNSTRPADFKLDKVLLDRLNESCAKLDLRQLPGIDQLQGRRPSGVVSMEYAPWTVGR